MRQRGRRNSRAPGVVRYQCIIRVAGEPDDDKAAVLHPRGRSGNRNARRGLGGVDDVVAIDGIDRDAGGFIDRQAKRSRRGITGETGNVRGDRIGAIRQCRMRQRIGWNGCRPRAI